MLSNQSKRLDVWGMEASHSRKRPIRYMHGFPSSAATTPATSVRVEAITSTSAPICASVREMRPALVPTPPKSGAYRSERNSQRGFTYWVNVAARRSQIRAIIYLCLTSRIANKGWVMFPAVQSNFPAFSTKFEGRVPYMYLDILGLVTVGVGNLIDPVEAAQSLPFCFKTKPGISAPGSAATPAQIAQEWQTLKNDPSLATKGYTACEPITQLELSDDAIDSIVLAKLAQNENLMKSQQW